MGIETAFRAVTGLDIWKKGRNELMAYQEGDLIDNMFVDHQLWWFTPRIWETPPNSTSVLKPNYAYTILGLSDRK